MKEDRAHMEFADTLDLTAPTALLICVACGTSYTKKVDRCDCGASAFCDRRESLRELILFNREHDLDESELVLEKSDPMALADATANRTIPYVPSVPYVFLNHEGRVASLPWDWPDGYIYIPKKYAGFVQTAVVYKSQSQIEAEFVQSCLRKSRIPCDLECAGLPGHKGYPEFFWNCLVLGKDEAKAREVILHIEHAPEISMDDQELPIELRHIPFAPNAHDPSEVIQGPRLRQYLDIEEGIGCRLAFAKDNGVTELRRGEELYAKITLDKGGNWCCESAQGSWAFCGYDVIDLTSDKLLAVLRCSGNSAILLAPDRKNRLSNLVFAPNTLSWDSQDDWVIRYYQAAERFLECKWDVIIDPVARGRPWITLLIVLGWDLLNSTFYQYGD